MGRWSRVAGVAPSTSLARPTRMEGMLEPGGVRDSREDDNLEPLNLADYQVRLASAAVAVQYLFTLHGQHDD
jgi:hypothetical protein